MAAAQIYLFKTASETCSEKGVPLPNHWVYWREGAGDTEILHADPAARLTKLKKGGDPRKAADYSEPFLSATGTKAYVFVRPDTLDPVLPGEHTERELTVHLLQREESAFRVASDNQCVINLVTKHLRSEEKKKEKQEKQEKQDDGAAQKTDAGKKGKSEPVAAIFVKTVIKRIKPAVAVTRDAEGKPGVLACSTRAKGSAAPCKIALTFDDGPNPKTTPMVLDVLKDFKAPGLFFVLGDRFDYSDRSEPLQEWKACIGEHMKRNPGAPPFNAPNNKSANASVLTRMVEEGHQLGLHMFWHAAHQQVCKDSAERTRVVTDSLKRAKDAVCDLLVGLPKPARGDVKKVLRNLVRLPYGDGAHDKGVLAAIHTSLFRHVYWDYDTNDWDAEAHPWRREYLAENLMNDICLRAEKGRLGGVALFHDVRATTGERLGGWLRKLQDAGHEFVTIDEVAEFSTSLSQPTSAPQKSSEKNLFSRQGFVDPSTREVTFDERGAGK